ncbi:hypothetical protein FOBRF1_013676 [Fusarium oxysporum]
MREGAGTDALFKLAFHAERIVLLDIVSPRSQVSDQSREGIKGLQYVIGPVEDAEEIALKPKYLHFVRIPPQVLTPGDTSHNSVAFSVLRVSTP